MSRGFIKSRVIFLVMVSTIIENVKDVIAAGTTLVDSAKTELIWLLPPAMLAFAIHYGIPKKSKMLIEKGGRVRGLTEISGTNIDVVRTFMDIGEDVRHIDQYRGEFMLVADTRESISSIPQQTVNVADVSLDNRVVAFWTDDPSYAAYLTTTFEAAWTDAVDAKERIQELLGQGAP